MPNDGLAASSSSGKAGIAGAQAEATYYYTIFELRRYITGNITPLKRYNTGYNSEGEWWEANFAWDGGLQLL